MRCSIVIPAYNESRRIERTLKKVLAYVAQQGWDADVIIVNDGSRDNTADIVRRYAGKNAALRLIENPSNRGKGYSVRSGMLHARGDVMLFSDADLSAPIEESAKLLEQIQAGAAVAIGSRWIKPELQTQKQSLHRQVFGRVFNLALRAVLGLRFKDTQCGFKAFSRRAVDIIFPLQKIERWAFDPEVIFLAEKHGCRVVEVPVQWAHEGGGSIHPVRDGIRMLWEVLKVRWYWSTRKYDLAARSSTDATSESRARSERG
ncbi:MAG TPA: dolichyl-phosphate beta-glucosyltransferase [Terriglobales bacterium]|nr:dolichyl-phosphate beta-glucosyltransferase [Terriglobales bacterium]